MNGWRTNVVIGVFCGLLAGCGLYAIEKGQQALPDNNQGMAYLKQGRYDDAIAAFNRALAIYPKFGASLGGRGDAYMGKALYDEAIADYSKVIEIASDNPWACMNRAKAYFMKKEYQKAWTDVNKARSLGLAIERNPEYSAFVDRLKEASGRQE